MPIQAALQALSACSRRLPPLGKSEKPGLAGQSPIAPNGKKSRLVASVGGDNLTLAANSAASHWLLVKRHATLHTAPLLPLVYF